MNKKTIYSTLFVFGFIISVITASGLFAQEDPSLKEVYKDYFKIGGAINQNQSDEKDLKGVTIIKKHFNTITSENIMKWERIHPLEGKYNFEPGGQLCFLR